MFYSNTIWNLNIFSWLYFFASSGLINSNRLAEYVLELPSAYDTHILFSEKSFKYHNNNTKYDPALNYLLHIGRYMETQKNSFIISDQFFYKYNKKNNDYLDNINQKQKYIVDKFFSYIDKPINLQTYKESKVNYIEGNIYNNINESKKLNTNLGILFENQFNKKHSYYNTCEEKRSGIVIYSKTNIQLTNNLIQFISNNLNNIDFLKDKYSDILDIYRFENIKRGDSEIGDILFYNKNIADYKYNYYIPVLYNKTKNKLLSIDKLNEEQLIAFNDQKYIFQQVNDFNPRQFNNFVQVVNLDKKLYEGSRFFFNKLNNNYLFIETKKSIELGHKDKIENIYNNILDNYLYFWLNRTQNNIF